MPAAAKALVMNSYANMSFHLKSSCPAIAVRKDGVLCTPMCRASRNGTLSVMMLMPMFVTVTVTVVVEVIGALDVAAPRHHENMAIGAQHLNIGAIKP